MEGVFAQQLSEGVAPASSPETDADLTHHSNSGDGSEGRPRTQLGALNSRKDVIRTLEQICTYYKDHEPASPVPLLLRRAIRLVDKSFVEILQDLAPDSLDQIQRLSGETEADDS